MAVILFGAIRYCKSQWIIMDDNGKMYDISEMDISDISGSTVFNPLAEVKQILDRRDIPELEKLLACFEKQAEQFPEDDWNELIDCVKKIIQECKEEQK